MTLNLKTENLLHFSVKNLVKYVLEHELVGIRPCLRFSWSYCVLSRC